MDSFIFKMHIVLSEEEKAKWKNKNVYGRTSDNFLIYAQHWCEENYYILLDIITPNAHKRIDKLLPLLINEAEKFHSMDKKELDNL